MKYIFLALLLAGFACSSNKVHEVEKTGNIQVNKALQNGVFQLKKDASWVSVRTLKNGFVPVKGTLNFSKGTLDLNDLKNFLELKVNLLSWDSGLSQRDSRVKSVFFAASESNSEAVFKVTEVSPEIIDGFRKEKSFQKYSVKGQLTLAGKTTKVRAILNGSFDQKGRLRIKSLNPIELKISELGLSDNLKKLIEICNHRSVENVVELNVDVVFVP